MTHGPDRFRSMRTKDEESRSIDTLPVSTHLLQMLQTLVERRFNKVIVATICVIEPGNGKPCAVQHLPATGERGCKTLLACQPDNFERGATSKRVLDFGYPGQNVLDRARFRNRKRGVPLADLYRPGPHPRPRRNGIRSRERARYRWHVEPAYGRILPQHWSTRRNFTVLGAFRASIIRSTESQLLSKRVTYRPIISQFF